MSQVEEGDKSYDQLEVLNSQTDYLEAFLTLYLASTWDGASQYREHEHPRAQYHKAIK